MTFLDEEDVFETDEACMGEDASELWERKVLDLEKRLRSLKPK